MQADSPATEESKTSPDPTETARLERAMWAHAVPFLLWIFLMPLLGDPSGWNYTIRSVVCLGVFLWLRPWRHYPALTIRNLPLALLVGIVVFVLWVLPESAWMARKAPGFHTFYQRYLVGIWPFGQLREPVTKFPYAPETAGWTFALIRLAGSAFVIAVIEEFFWRGFVYRWMQRRNWLSQDPGTYDRTAFWLTALVFAVEHNEWFAGLLAGIAYGWLYLRTRDIWAAVAAHVITNYLLGWYVLVYRAYEFW